mmetsp:Transcript_17804/g.56931  ORF Transcript_17804/g.56931 Transcript_17804/m.56931 type:complete len:204 (+) Transcript_17804:694-1305(+)
MNQSPMTQAPSRRDIGARCDSRHARTGFPWPSSLPIRSPSRRGRPSRLLRPVSAGRSRTPIRKRQTTHRWKSSLPHSASRRCPTRAERARYRLCQCPHQHLWPRHRSRPRCRLSLQCQARVAVPLDNLGRTPLPHYRPGPPGAYPERLAIRPAPSRPPQAAGQVTRPPLSRATGHQAPRFRPRGALCAAQAKWTSRTVIGSAE